MSTSVIMRAVPGGMMAINAIESAKLEPLRGKEYAVKISQPRNLKFHRRYFALLGVGLDMADTEYTAEQFRAYVTCGAGYCDFMTDPDGGVVAIPKSISFAAMDETEFERLYQDTLSFICSTWALDSQQIDEIVRFL